MIIEILTLFPDYFQGPFTETILGRAVTSGVVKLRTTDIRSFATGKHRVTDDTPFGGGAGMLLKVEPVVAAIESTRPSHVVMMSPAGDPLTQARVAELATHDHLVIVCGRYEGVDHRVTHFIDQEISVGDYVLSGGEPAAACVVDAVVRMLPGALGHPDSAGEESFADGLLDILQYTRPREFRGMSVPDVLLGGDHQAIARWRRLESLRRTALRRPDLLDTAPLNDEERAFLAETAGNETE